MANNIKISILVIYDSIDGNVHVSSAIHIRQNLKKGVLLITNGLRNTKILRDNKTINKIVYFIKQ